MTKKCQVIFKFDTLMRSHTNSLDNTYIFNWKKVESVAKLNNLNLIYVFEEESILIYPFCSVQEKIALVSLSDSIARYIPYVSLMEQLDRFGR